MQIVFHGAGQEVGRSCILINNQFLLDAGLKLTDKGDMYPTSFDPRPIQAVFISHAHLDHTGALPLLNHDGLQCKVYATKLTKLTTQLLLEDSLHIESISNVHPGYAEKNILNVLEHFIDVQYNKQYKVNKNTTVQFIDAGHIPGSASILVTHDNKRLFYTGDINHQTTQLLKRAQQPPKNVDIMITEATYGDRGHPQRRETEQQFIETIKNTLGNKGSVLVPAFAVGRAQELMLLLAQQKDIVCPIYLDGMARKVTDIYLQYPEAIKDHVALRYAAKRIQHITSKTQRQQALKEQCIIITTSGMVTGGPVMDYLKLMFMTPMHAILLTGYQAEGTNGRLLLQEKAVFVDGKRLQWTGHIGHFDFSAHAGQQELLDAIAEIQPKHLIIQHGDPIAIEILANKAREYVKNVKKVYTPKINDVIIIP